MYVDRFDIKNDATRSDRDSFSGGRNDAGKPTRYNRILVLKLLKKKKI